MRITCLAFALVIACAGGSSQHPVRPSTPAAPAAVGDDCRVLRDRVTTAFVRLQALDSGEVTAAHYQALGDVMDKLARDLDQRFADGSVAALASDYREAAQAVVGASRDTAALLEKAEVTVAQLQKPDGPTARLVEQVQRIAQDCKDGAAADCMQVVTAMRRLAPNTTTSATVQSVIAALGGVTFTTASLEEHTAAAAASLAAIRDALATGEQLDKDAHAKITAYARAVGLLRGLNQRGDQLCPAS